MLSAKAHNALQDLHNSSCHTKASNNLFSHFQENTDILKNVPRSMLSLRSHNVRLFLGSFKI